MEKKGEKRKEKKEKKSIYGVKEYKVQVWTILITVKCSDLFHIWTS